MLPYSPHVSSLGCFVRKQELARTGVKPGHLLAQGMARNLPRTHPGHTLTLTLAPGSPAFTVDDTPLA